MIEGNRTHSIRRRLIRMVMMSCTTVVILACAAFTAQDVIDIHNDQDNDLLGLGQVIGANSSAALTFGDEKAANELLLVLRTRPSIIGGCIYNERDQPFATYYNGPVIPLTKAPRSGNGIVHRGGRVEFFQPIFLDGARIGTLYIVSDLRDLYSRMKEDAQFVAVVLLVCLIVAFILSSRLQGRISKPIVELARVAGEVSERKDYTVRAASQSPRASDEISDLVIGFNSMLADIEQRDHSLLKYQTELEQTVTLRTEELLVAKDSAEKIAEINAQLARDSALILNSVSDGILGIGVDNHTTFLNPAAARMLGMTPEGSNGKTIHEAIHHSHADGTPMAEADCPNRHAMIRGESFVVPNDTFWRSDGTSFPTEYSSTQMRDDGGNIIGSVIMFRDVTERRAVEKLKSEFVSTVSHELRTPLTSIRGALGLLSSGMLGAIGEKAQRMLSIAVNNTDRLVRLINDILDLERIESGKVELLRGHVDAHMAMNQALESVQSIADAAGVRLVLEPVTATLWGDNDRIIQTLTNLVGNAIKFSRAGHYGDIERIGRGLRVFILRR